MLKRNKSNKRKGQTAIEYALVIAVLCAGIVFAGRSLFGTEDGAAVQLLQGAIEKARGTYDGNEG